MEKEEKVVLVQILVAALLLGLSFLSPLPEWSVLAFCTAAYLVCGWEVVFKAFKNIFKGRFLDENFLMTIATLGAFAIGEYPEAAAVMLFFQIGEFFQDMAVGKSRASIAALMDIRPDYANVEDASGKLVKTDPASVEAGSTIIVLPGEKVPIDGTIISGHSSLDTAALTGESLPRDVNVGDTVFGGSVNLNGLLRIKTTTAYSESTVARILELVQNTGNNKARREKFISRFARYYTPVVVIIALLLATVPPLFFGAIWHQWIYRALVFLVVSCPCALVVSIPLTFFAGIGCASKRGILIKGAQHLETLSEVRTIAFDKTGTLTKGEFAVQGIYPITPGEEALLLEQAALTEMYSTHPIAASVREAYGNDLDPNRIKDLKTIDGEGVSAIIDNRIVYVGNEKLMRRVGVDFYHEHPIGISVHVSIGNHYLGYIVVADRIKDEAAQAIEAIHKAGVNNTVILTGDHENIAHAVAREMGIDNYYADLLPQQKVEKMTELQSLTPGKTAFAGDGINDAPVLKSADVGIAMGAIGSDAAIEAADIVIMDDNPLKIASAIDISKRTLRIVKQNIILSLGIKFCVLILGATGIINMWLAVFADVGVTVLAVLNAIRAMYFKKTI